MKPQELRIGNLCEYDGKIFTIKTIGNKIISADRGKGLVDFRFEDLKQIMLTEDLLLKFGFEINKINQFAKKGFDYVIFNMQLFPNCDCQTDGVKLNHVHQLQNIYFALTGEELVSP